MRKSRHRKLWIWLWITVIVVAIIGSGIGIGVKIHMDIQRENQRNQEQMVKIMYSKEVQLLIQDDLKNVDKKAFTPGGVVQSFKIKKDSIDHNPMGGIDAEVIINGNSKFNVGVNIDKENGKYSQDVIGMVSGALDDAIGDEQ